MKRRTFLYVSAWTTGAALIPAGTHASVVPIRITLHPERKTNPIPARFTGLSYETAQLANPAFFSGANAGLAAFFRGLGTGVLRIGGNTSAFSQWSKNPPPVAPDAVFGPDTGRQAPPRRPVGPAAIRNLRDFLDATGWTLIYGLNMGGGTPETAAEEAAYVMQTIGPKLVAFQLCNEPDLFARNGVRGPGYDYETFAGEWQRFFAAVRTAVPDAPFAGPDTAFNTDWLVPFAKRFGKDIGFLTQHYYAEGPPSDPSMTIGRLLRPDPSLARQFEGMSRTRREAGLPFRMAETNSCWGGGKEGVSDTFASALWGGDLMYQLAAAGGSGINFHGGGYGWYTPIAGDPGRGFAARPLYHALRLIAEAGPGTLIETEMSGAAGLLTAYGLRAADGALKLAVFNKDSARDVSLLIDPGTAVAAAKVQRLTAPRLDSKMGVAFSEQPEHLALTSGKAVLALPRASAALVTF